MIRKILPILIVASVAACAKNPDAIAPVSMGDAYAHMSCASAYQMLQQERQKQAALEVRQRQAVAGDAVGVFLIGVPVSSLSGANVEGDLAATKGKVIALEQRMSRC